MDLHRRTPRGSPDACPRRPGRSAAAAVIVIAGLAVSACGASGSSSAPTILNTEKVERAIEQSALTQRQEHATVSCPAGVRQKQGVTFSCTALVGNTATQFVVTELNASGNVHYAAR
jgi:hypothetical protein